MTQKQLADYLTIYIFYVAYCLLYTYKKLVNVVRTTGSRGEVFVIDTANTLEKAQIEKISNVPEKGYQIFQNK